MGIGVLLLERGLITKEQLEAALAQQRATGERLDRVLVTMGLVTRGQVLHAIGDQFHMPVIDLATTAVEPDVLEMLPAKLVYRQGCVPINRDNGTLTVATSDPFELSVLDELRLLTGCSIDLVLADEEELQKFIRAHYGVGGGTLDEMAGEEAEVSGRSAAESAADEVEQAQEASVIKLVNDLLIEAINERATDIHVEPYEEQLQIRYRIDGVLQHANVPASINRFGLAIISRVKIMANLNIAEKRKPQDGRITFRHRSRERGIEEFDLRVSVIPMLFGEGIVLRILNKSAALMSLEDLGMPPSVFDVWDDLIGHPHGILLVTGPTGSGKSTTLYASLNRIVNEQIKTITIEDPVEYHVDGVNQIQVSSKVGMSFAAGLRAVLRHDPDVVMVGEIRDLETAETAIQASLTGHLVFSTLHTNNATGAVTRLLDMGVEPYLVTSSVEGVLAQRLVRRLCRECRTLKRPEAAEFPRDFEVEPGRELFHPTGCRECRQTGFRGRVGVYELLRMNDAIRELIMDRVNAPVIAKRADEDGELLRIRRDGYQKVLDGVTTIQELLRALTA
jgi:type II secretory ATPase GspE/PulE/Tfp pilus assembly ATPase PilB-like protein